MIRWLQEVLWLGDSYRDDPEHARLMRGSWQKAAEELGLRHIVGADTFGDQIEGVINGYRVDVTYRTNFDAQKPETIVRVRNGDTDPSLPILGREALLRRYEENAGTRNELIAEETAWLLGQWDGIGIHGNEHELCYQQLYWMYDPADITFVCLAMVKVMRYLDPNMTKLQG
jgi:hypothetical protein